MLDIKSEVGHIGEEIAEKFLVKHGYRILERNYRKKCGEIDIIALKNKVLSFVEVKTESQTLKNVSPETFERCRPEERVDDKKLKKISRAVQIYLMEKRVSEKTDWEFTVVSIVVDKVNKLARVKIIKDVIPE